MPGWRRLLFVLIGRDTRLQTVENDNEWTSESLMEELGDVDE
jgi:hypothetical protein